MGDVREDLIKRFRDLEASQAKLREQLQDLLRDAGGQKDESNLRGREGQLDMVMMSGKFVRNPYLLVLHQLGHALHICGPASGEVIYWNRAAEVLYGWKSYEVLNQKVTDLLIDDHRYSYWEKIMEKAFGGEMWSGVFSFRKRSGELFKAILTVNPLYENGVCIGVIAVSSDASIFNMAKSERSIVLSDEACSQPRQPQQNSKRVYCPLQPLVTSSMSSLAEKAFAKLNTLVNGNQASELERNSESNSAYISADDSFQIDQLRESPPSSTTDAKYCASCYANTVRCTVQERNSDSTALGRNYHEETMDIVSSRNGSTVSRGVPHYCTSQMESIKMIPIVDNLIERLPEPTKSNSSTSPKMEDMRISNLPTSSETCGGSESGSSNVGEIEPNLVSDSEIQWEDLLLGEVIGEGSYAVVYHGLWNGSDVAIKVYARLDYRESALLDYKKEIAIMKNLRHPNVLLFMGAVYSSEHLAIVTEYLPRGSLFKILHKNNQALDLKKRLRMALDVVKGMNYLHRRNPPIIHLDLKSSNLLVDKAWTVKVGDFGLSCLKISTLLTAKTGRGTPQWMAPEVLRGECSSEKSDVFSFGVILWELMTESVPWSNLNPMQVVGVVGFMDRRLDIPDGIDPVVAGIISDCCASDPFQRPSFQTLVERVTALTVAMALPPLPRQGF